MEDLLIKSLYIIHTITNEFESPFINIHKGEIKAIFDGLKASMWNLSKAALDSSQSPSLVEANSAAVSNKRQERWHRVQHIGDLCGLLSCCRDGS